MNRHSSVSLFVPHAGCPHQCSFCNQRHITGSGAAYPTPDAIRAACERAIVTMKTPPEQSEIAFFGGSFTAIPAPVMRELLRAAAPYVKAGYFRGIRLSTRPDAVDEDILETLTYYGVSAVELGAQSMDDAVLRANERGHTADDVRSASLRLKQYGFEVGLQMMTGLYQSSEERDRFTARELAALNPDTVRVYPTLVMEHTPLAQLYRQGLYTPPSLEQTVALCSWMLHFFEEEQGIPVIRLGLHADEDMQRHLVAGPWHPAFRELCESAQLLQKARAMLAAIPKGDVYLLVSPQSVSAMVGQRRNNIYLLAGDGYTVTVKADDSVPRGEVICRSSSEPLG